MPFPGYMVNLRQWDIDGTIQILLTTFACDCFANMESRFVETASAHPRYKLVASVSKTFSPDAIASSSSVGGSV